MLNISNLWKTHLVMLILIGCWIAVIFIEPVPWVNYQAKAIKTFVPIQGEIIDKTLRGRGKKYFTISYQYNIEGKMYSNNKIFPLLPTPLRRGRIFPVDLSYGMFQNIYDKYKTRTLATVYYNPLKPEDSYLIREVRTDVYFRLLAYVVGLCFISVFYFEHLYCDSKGYKDFDIHPKESILGMNFWKYFFLGCFWHFCGIWSLLHFLSISSNVGFTYSGLVAMILYELIGLIWFSLLLFFKISSPGIRQYEQPST